MAEPHEAADGTAVRIRTSGPVVPCGNHALNSIALVFHELTTNAAKYGALGSEAGFVEANWRLHDQALLRDQVVRLGRMSAFERVAHMMLEIHERLGQVGLVSGTTFHLPLTQEMVSDVVGLSVVHLNRTLQNLRRYELVGFQHGYVTLKDRARLARVASYASAYPAAWRPSDRPSGLAPAPRGALPHPWRGNGPGYSSHPA